VILGFVHHFQTCLKQTASEQKAFPKTLDWEIRRRAGLGSKNQSYNRQFKIKVYEIQTSKG